MKAEHIEKLVSMLGCDKIRTAGNKVKCTCPLAPWKHGDGVDSKPSFAVFVRDDDSSSANCMSAMCGFHGSLTDLIYRMQRLSGRDLSSQILFVYENNQTNLDKMHERVEKAGGHYAQRDPARDLPASVKGGKDYSDPLTRASQAPALPDDAVLMMDKMVSWIDDESMEYLTGPSRLLTAETITKWKLGWHPQARRVSVPQFDHIGRLVNLSGRYLPLWPKFLPPSEREDKAPKWMHSNGFERELYLFGEDWFDVSGGGTGTVFIVEGAFDVIYLNQCGLKNVAGINGSHINKTQVDKLLKWFDSAVILMDGDPPGVAAAKRIETMLSKRMHVVNHLISDDRDPNQLSQGEVDDLRMKFQP